jgi:hypothetical protein
MVRKLANQPILSIHDRRQIGLGRNWTEPKFLRSSEKGRDFRRTQNGLCRHATTQDTEPPKWTLIHNRHVSAGIPRSPRRGIARRPTADDDHVMSLACRSLTL